MHKPSSLEVPCRVRPSRARVLRIDLAGLGPGQRLRPGASAASWVEAAWCDARAERLARLSGASLGLLLLAREHGLPLAQAAHSGPAPATALTPCRPTLVLSVGECVRAGLPTAARTSLCARSPLTGLYSEGQVGSDLGARLARVVDALVLTGCARARGALLHLREDASVELLEWPELAGLDPAACWSLVEARLGPCALLRIGPAGEERIPFASLAAGESQPSFVGRGGLGAVFGALGLKGLAVSAAPVEREPGEPEPGELETVPRARALLLAWLARSPRLRARGAGGTLELLHARAASGELYQRNYAEPLAPQAAAGLAREAERAGSARHGCRGCPTPCGWVFERADGGEQRAHFGATYALGPNLGLESFADALELLADCDRAGVDARESGAVLALWCRAQELGRVAGPSAFGDRARLQALLRRMLAGQDEGAWLRLGSVRMARELGLETESYEAGGQAARPERGLASVLGQCVSTGGSDPMRSFPFLVDLVGPASATGAASPASSAGATSAPADSGPLARLLAPLPLPEGAADPLAAAGKGRSVWWHENLMAAIDTSGFCAFSAAGLLEDGLCDLDELASAIAPRALLAQAQPDARWQALSPGRRMLAAGASIVLLRHALNVHFDARHVLAAPRWARALLDLPGMLREYLGCRGLDAQGRPLGSALERLGSAELAEPCKLQAESEPQPGRALVTDALASAALRALAVAPPGALAAAQLGRARGRVHLRAVGPLGARLGAELDLELPESVRGVLELAARTWPAARPLLLRAGQPVPAVFRAGARMASDASCSAGDTLDLVVAIGGG